jgi:plasmid maintenance system antidote protein VapI
MQPGAEQLKDWMDRRWPSSTRPQRDAAAHFGWDETFISKLCRGERSPGLTNAIRIERETGIPVEAWMSSDLDETAAVSSGKVSKRRQDKV